MSLIDKNKTNLILLENNKAEYFAEGIFKEKQKYLWSRMTATIYELFKTIKQ